MRPILFFGGRFSAKLYKIHLGQKDGIQRIQSLNLHNPIWIHAASLGEYEMALPLIEQLHVQNPEIPFLISFFSPSGFDNAKLPDYCYKIYLGIDTPKQAGKFIDALKPQKVIFIKYEIWLNHLKACHNRKIPVFYWNLILRKDHFVFSRWGKPWLSVLQKCQTLFCQNSITIQLLESKDFNNCLQTGDIRFNRANEIQNLELPNIILDHSNGELLNWLLSGSKLILGSSWPTEELMLLEVLKSRDLLHKVHQQLKIIIVPHDISFNHIQTIQKQFSDFQTQLFSEPVKNEFQILIVDQIGILSRLYRFANIAFIGGGFSGQLHNIIEPAAAGCFTLYGPNAKKFPEAELFEELNIGNKINDSQELAQKIELYFQGDYSVNKDYIKHQVHLQMSNIQRCVDVILSSKDSIQV